jgi:hypothetical protein
MKTRSTYFEFLQVNKRIYMTTPISLNEQFNDGFDRE